MAKWCNKLSISTMEGGRKSASITIPHQYVEKGVWEDGDPIAFSPHISPQNHLELTLVNFADGKHTELDVIKILQEREELTRDLNQFSPSVRETIALHRYRKRVFGTSLPTAEEIRQQNLKGQEEHLQANEKLLSACIDGLEKRIALLKQDLREAESQLKKFHKIKKKPNEVKRKSKKA